MNDFVEANGGIVSDRVVAPDKQTNADYVFHDAKVIAELKILMEDPFSNKEFLESEAAKKASWIETGYLTEEQMAQVRTIDQLPEQCYRDIVKLYTGVLKRDVKKASKQIKATREKANLENYKGLLIIVSDGNFLLDPNNIGKSLAGLLREGQYSGINTVVYLTVNVMTMRIGDPTKSRLFVYFWRNAEKMEQEVPLEFLKGFFDKWVDHYMALTGLSLDKISEIDERGITEVNHLKQTRFISPVKLAEKS